MLCRQAFLPEEYDKSTAAIVSYQEEYFEQISDVHLCKCVD